MKKNKKMFNTIIVLVVILILWSLYGFFSSRVEQIISNLGTGEEKLPQKIARYYANRTIELNLGNKNEAKYIN